MDGMNDYYREHTQAHLSAAKELFRVLSNKDTRKERMVVSNEFRMDFWGDERPFMVSTASLNQQAAALLQAKKQPLTQVNINRIAMTLRRSMRMVFENKSKHRAA